MSYHAHAFVDGGYVTRLARDAKMSLVDPYSLAMKIVTDPIVRGWASPGFSRPDAVVVEETVLTRVTYYDGRPDDDSETPEETREYWSAIERLPDTALGFGTLRGKRSHQPRQKSVDTLMAVDMLVGAFTGIFSLAVLVSGDADFVPVVDEVRRRGVEVIVAAGLKHLSQELRDAGDRFVQLNLTGSDFPALKLGERTWH